MKRSGKRAFRFSSALLAVLLSVMLASTMAGCNTPAATTAPAGSEAAAASPAGSDAATVTPTESPTAPPAALTFKDEITIDYFWSSTYQGLLNGWYAKILKDKFNMKINIVSTAVAGAEIYQTRSAAGNLGDLAVLNSVTLMDSVKAGLFMDMTGLLDQYGPDLKAFSGIAIQSVQKFLDTDKIYAIPVGVSTLSPVDPLLNVMGATVSTQNGGAPYLRWDVYQAIGSPKINTMDDLLSVLQQMQQQSSTSISGKKTYGFSFFKDWDGAYMVAAATSFPQMYGYAIYSGNSSNTSLLIYGDPTTFQTQRLDEDNGLYYKTLELFFKANQMGLVDPDSPSQDFTTTSDKVKDGQILFYWWPWMSIWPYNNDTNGNADPPTGFEFVPIADQIYYDSGYSPLGQTGEYVGIGSKAKDPARMMAFLNWLVTPEGEEIAANGPKGLFWDVDASGQPVVTDLGKQVAVDNTIPIPDSWGGGTMKDDNNFVSMMVNQDENDPNFNVPYNRNMWPSVRNGAATKLDLSWQAAMGAENMVDYCKKHGMLSVSPGNSYVAPADSTDIQNKRSQCGKVIDDASWQMIFAKDQAAFDSIWADMKAQLQGLGWEDVVALDLNNAKDYNAACLATIAEANGK